MTRERENREWGERMRYWVYPRLTRSKRNLVRQQISGRWTNRNHDGKFRGRVGEMKVELLNRNSRSFLFRNFPIHFKFEALRDKFGEFGEVVDIMR